MVLYEKVLPHSQAEAIVKDDYFLFRQNFAEPSVSLHIELFQKSAGNVAGTFGLLFVCSFLSAGGSHIDAEADGLVKHFNSKQLFPVAVTHCQPLQYSQYKFHLIRLLAPFAHALDSAIVIAVLSAGCSVKVDENLQSVFSSPVKGFIQIFNTSGIGFSVSENKIRYRNADGV